MTQTKNTKTNQQKTKNPSEVGCIWKKFNQNNVEYLSIKLELDGNEYFLKAFLNGNKSNDNPNDRRPNWILYKSNPKNNNYDENVVNDNRSNVEKRLGTY